MDPDGFGQNHRTLVPIGLCNGQCQRRKGLPVCVVKHASLCWLPGVLLLLLLEPKLKVHALI